MEKTSHSYCKCGCLFHVFPVYNEDLRQGIGTRGKAYCWLKSDGRWSDSDRIRNRCATVAAARQFHAVCRTVAIHVDPLTGELPREIVEERFVRSLNRLIETGGHTLKNGQTARDAAHSILLDLTREGESDYAWLANSMDVASHRYLYRLTARAHRAIEALDRLEDTTKALSGAQANSIIMEIENARMQLTADPRERIRLLKKDIEERQKEIDELEHSEALEKLTSEQVGDIIGVIHNTLRGVPIDLRELALSERDNGDALRRRMQAAL